jgi:MFS family permease
MRLSPFLVNEVGIPLKWVGQVMSIQQWAEMGLMLILGSLIRKLGYKWVMAIACLGHAIPAMIYATHQPIALVIAIQPFHALCYTLFYISAYLYVERCAAPDAKHSAQTVFGIVSLGVGPIAAGLYNQFFDRFTINGQQDYTQLWWSMVLVAVVGMLIMAAAFPRNAGVDPPTEATPLPEAGNEQLEF